MQKTKIEWADYVSNPVKAVLKTKAVTGFTGRKAGHACVKISAGCAHCWASAMNVRLGTGLEYSAENMARVETVLDMRELDRLAKFSPRGPFKNGRGRAVVFLGDMTDLFGEWVTLEMCDAIWRAVEANQRVDFVILTKRPGRMRSYILGRSVRPSVFLGASVEAQRQAEERQAAMAALARAGWQTVVSYEPALGYVDWRGWESLDWLICGGESGAEARPMDAGMARSARDFCAHHSIPFFFKQWGEFAPVVDLVARGVTTFKHCPAGGMVKVGKGLAGHVLDGREWREVPNG